MKDNLFIIILVHTPPFSFETPNTAPGEFSGSISTIFFDYNLRNTLGLDPTGTEFINIDALDPSQFSLDMFSADELLNNGDNYVNILLATIIQETKLVDVQVLDDFFNKKDQYTNYTTPIGAFEPISYWLLYNGQIRF